MSEQNVSAYRGRFAPTPSGPLHFGSLTTAVGSYLQAKSQNGQWRIRIDDLDPPRVVKGAADTILKCLEIYGLNWDGPVLYQSSRHDAYQAALDELNKIGMIYPCACSRKDIKDTLAANRKTSLVYPGTCRNGLKQGQQAETWRVKTDNSVIEFEDLFLGTSSQHVQKKVGDFLVKRVGDYYAYHLAVVVDDAYQGYTEIIRGYDLLESAHRQIFLQKLLNIIPPAYGHLPLVLNDQGKKMSKQNLTEKSIINSDPVPTLCAALRVLGQPLPEGILESDIDSFWEWAIKNWRVEAVPAGKAAPYPVDF